MTAKTYPFALDTLGRLLDEGYVLESYCDRGCGGRHQGPVDLAALTARLGRDHPCGMRELRRHLPCPDCLGDLTIRVHPPAQPETGGAHGLSRREPAASPAVESPCRHVSRYPTAPGAGSPGSLIRTSPIGHGVRQCDRSSW